MQRHGKSFGGWVVRAMQRIGDGMGAKRLWARVLTAAVAVMIAIGVVPVWAQAEDAIDEVLVEEEGALIIGENLDTSDQDRVVKKLYPDKQVTGDYTFVAGHSAVSFDYYSFSLLSKKTLHLDYGSYEKGREQMTDPQGRTYWSRVAWKIMLVDKATYEKSLSYPEMLEIKMPNDTNYTQADYIYDHAILTNVTSLRGEYNSVWFSDVDWGEGTNFTSSDTVTLDAGEYYIFMMVYSKDGGFCDYKLVVRTESIEPLFPDVPEGHWAFNVVSEAAARGLISGYSSGLFGTDDNITRGQVAVILWNMSGKPAAGAAAKSFPDVDPGAYYAKAVAWASSAGVVSGFSDGTFGPDRNVTREQLAVMLANYAGKVGGLSVSGSSADYASMSDAASVSAYATQAVGWCFTNRIMSGAGGKVMPQGNATRAQAAKMVVFMDDMVD